MKRTGERSYEYAGHIIWINQSLSRSNVRETLNWEAAEVDAQCAVLHDLLGRLWTKLVYFLKTSFFRILVVKCWLDLWSFSGKLGTSSRPQSSKKIVQDCTLRINLFSFSIQSFTDVWFLEELVLNGLHISIFIWSFSGVFHFFRLPKEQNRRSKRCGHQ